MGVHFWYVKIYIGFIFKDCLAISLCLQLSYEAPQSEIHHQNLSPKYKQTWGCRAGFYSSQLELGTDHIQGAHLNTVPADRPLLFCLYGTRNWRTLPDKQRTIFTKSLKCGRGNTQCMFFLIPMMNDLDAQFWLGVILIWSLKNWVFFHVQLWVFVYLCNFF